MSPKKSIVLIFVLVELLCPLVAEEGFHPWSACISLGGNVNWLVTGKTYRDSVSYEGRNGWSVSLSLSYRFTRHFGLSSGLSWQQKGYVRSGSYLNQDVYASFGNTFLESPILFDFSFGSERIRMVTSLGGYLGYWQGMEISGRDVINDGLAADGVSTYQESGNFNSDRDNRFSAGLMAKVAFVFASPEGFAATIGFGYAHSLTDMSRDYQRNTINKYNSTVMGEVGLMLSWGGRK